MATASEAAGESKWSARQADNEQLFFFSLTAQFHKDEMPYVIEDCSTFVFDGCHDLCRGH